jgi:hypothetical protein
LYSGSSSGHATASVYPKHGETWCATEVKGGAVIYSPGATSYRMICYNGEVTHEECDSTRQKVCFENVTDKATGFREANCGVNEWADCWKQTTEENCGNVEVRDCSWIGLNGYSFSIEKGFIIESDSSGICVPKYAPGFVRNEDNSNVMASCGLASSACAVKMQKHVIGGWRCDDGSFLDKLFGNDKGDENNCECVEDENGDYDGGKTWAAKFENICQKMGDCGQKVNYIGAQGYQNQSLIITTIEE